jgi:dienelactone hydrolase
VRTAVSTNGLFADFYKPAEATGRLPAIIVLGGSEGGLARGTAREAWLLASHGYAALQLAYFGLPGLPEDMNLIPLEYFKAAIDWLRNQTEVDPDHIGILGTSIGGETVLLVASHYPEIKAVVAAAPSSVVFPGMHGRDVIPSSTYTLAAQPLPDLPYGASRFTSVYDLYAKGLAALDQHPDAVIPVERINGPVMLVCGEEDRLWPSCLMSRQVVARLKDKAFGYKVELLAYPNAGHYVFGPPLVPGSTLFVQLGALGGTIDGNQTARQDAWPRAMAFLDAALR